MKRTFLVNRHLSSLVATLGHLDEITVGDAGLPVPNGVPCIDLAVSPGIPAFMDVMAALRSELVIEGMIHAGEADESLKKTFADFAAGWEQEQEKNITISDVPHQAFKERSANSKAVIRTGETRPYCNLILVSGVAF